VLGNHLSVGEIQPFMVLSHLKSGKVRIPAHLQRGAHRGLPDVPVPADLGLNYPFFHHRGHRAEGRHAARPPEEAGGGLQEVSESKEFKDYVAQSAGMISYWKGPETFKKDFLRDYTKVGEIMKKYNITRD
jgi:tripartite-type tricarboxylate transporter receptor subunit TctC